MTGNSPDGLPVAVKTYQGNLVQAASALQFLISQAALVAYVFAAWRLTADMSWTGEFFLSNGLLSHWQVWLGLGILAQMTSSLVQRIRPAHLRETVR